MPDVQVPVAHIKATIVGKLNTYTAWGETTTDLPADPIGEVVVEVLQKAWTAGEDPVNCVVIIQFS
jgi:hypothetical protein